MSDDLAAWMLEQIAEDERDVREDPAWARWMIRPTKLASRIRRALAECEAKRRILERHAPRVGKELAEGDMICGCSDFYEVNATPWPCADVRDMASVWADRPGYREEWRP